MQILTKKKNNVIINILTFINEKKEVQSLFCVWTKDPTFMSIVIIKEIMIINKMFEHHQMVNKL